MDVVKFWKRYRTCRNVFGLCERSNVSVLKSGSYLALLPEFRYMAQTMSKTLFIAAGQGDLTTLKGCLEAGDDVDDLESGWTPLQWAASQGQAEAICLLLAAGANIDMPTDDGDTNALMLAALYSNADCVRLLLTYGATLHFKSPATADGKGGMTPLHNAAAVGSIEVTELLLNAGAEINSPCGGGWTPLMWAILKYRKPGRLPQTGKIANHYAVIELLLNRHADLHWIDEDGNSALTWAEESDLAEVVLLLKTAGAKSASIITSADANSQEAVQ